MLPKEHFRLVLLCRSPILEELSGLCQPKLADAVDYQLPGRGLNILEPMKYFPCNPSCCPAVFR